MQASWTCDACGWQNVESELCESCGQALHYQLDPPVDIPRAPGPLMLPEFWSVLMLAPVTLAGIILMMPSVGESLDISWYWFLVHVLVFGSATLQGLRALVFRLWFHQITLITPAHARSGTMIKPEVHIVPFETIRGVHMTLTFRELGFNSKGQLHSRLVERVHLNAGAPLRGRREHVFTWQLPAPAPLGRYMHLGTEMQVSVWRFLGRFLPELGMAASQIRQDGGWFLQLRLRRGPFTKVIERRIVLYAPGQELLVG